MKKTTTKMNELNNSEMEFIETINSLQDKAYHNALSGNPNPNPCKDVASMVKGFEELYGEKIAGSKDESVLIEIFTLLVNSCDIAANKGVKDRMKNSVAS